MKVCVHPRPDHECHPQEQLIFIGEFEAFEHFCERRTDAEPMLFLLYAYGRQIGLC